MKAGAAAKRGTGISRIRTNPRQSGTPRAEARSKRLRHLEIPRSGDIQLAIDGKDVKLTNLSKLFWPDLGIAKGDLIQYYADISPYLLPHLKDRAMVMKRYPGGAYSEFFFQKRAPVPRPDWIDICAIEHSSRNVIDFPIIRDLPLLLWVINLGCIDLNPWYARCDDVNRPDYLHFDLDPVTAAPGQKAVPFERVLEVSLLVRDVLADLKIPS